MKNVFISYKREDESFARQLRETLLAWGHDVWLDVVDIEPGAQPGMKGWDDSIHRGLRDCQVVVGVLSPESLKSPNVLDEWGWALENQRRLILLWLHDVVSEDISPRFIRIQRIDCRRDAAKGLQRLRQALESSAMIVRDIPEPSLMPRPDAPHYGREVMLQQVRSFWIHGVLDKALHAGALHIDIASRPDALLKHEDFGDYILPHNAEIGDLFDDMARELLILGAPGAGKTVMLLQLARDLIERAEKDAAQPTPVVINLSSWAVTRPPLDEWLIERLKMEYYAPYKLARQWVENGQLVLLLDGLDEVAEQYREGCAQRLNEFRRDYPFVGLAVCSRIADYEMLQTRLNLRGAILLQPLSPQQINSFVSRDGLEGLCELVQHDEVAREMAQTPFLLNSMGLAYHGMAYKLLRGFPSLASRRDHLFEHFIEKVFDPQAGYTFKELRDYLTWMAQSLTRREQIVFYIDDLQADLLTPEQRQKYKIRRWMLGSFFVLVLVMLAEALIVMLFGVRPVVMTVVAIIAALIVLGVMAMGWIFRRVTGQGRFSFITEEIHTVEIVKLSWYGAVFLGLVVVATVTAVFVLLALMSAQLAAVLWQNLALILGVTGYAVGVGAIFGAVLWGNIRFELISIPNQRIRSSIKHATRLTIIGTALITLLVAVVGSPQLILIIGLVSMFISAMSFGGEHLAKYAMLRHILYADRHIPWHYSRFLDDAARMGLLRKVGGGYIFVHRYLLDYFAGLDHADSR